MLHAVARKPYCGQVPSAAAASASAQARAETALGRHSLTASSFGTSPPGSFEHEVLAFMSSTSAPGSRARRRSLRRSKAPQVLVVRTFTELVAVFG